MARLDFELLRRLARDNPEAFEQMRSDLLEAAIAKAPQSRRRRLRGLQWRADQVRLQAANPMAACISLSEMMWESFAGCDGLVERLQKAESGRRGHGRQESARVIPLPGKERATGR